LGLSEGETTDTGFDSMLENESNVQSRDIVHRISPCKGSTKVFLKMLFIKHRLIKKIYCN